MIPNNLYAGYSYKEKIRFLAFREQLQEEERIRWIGELDDDRHSG
jgi:hypothetical protein